MRSITFLMALLAAGPALAAEGARYENARFGYAIDVPADFAGQGESANGDGQVFRAGDGTQKLSVWGGRIIEGSFESAVLAAIGFAGEDGWTISYERVTPSWASFSGTRNGIILYARTIALCEGAQYATYWLEYPERDQRRLEPVIGRLSASLRETGDGRYC